MSTEKGEEVVGEAFLQGLESQDITDGGKNYFPGSSRPPTTDNEQMERLANVLSSSSLQSTSNAFPGGGSIDENGEGLQQLHDQQQNQQQQKQQQQQDYNNGMWPEYCNPHYIMPAQIEVKVALASGDYYFPVAIVKQAEGTVKPYLGGYRDKRNGKIYHHGFTQTPTDRKVKVKDTTHLRSRDTQTYEVRTLSVQPYRETGTQMERVDVSIDAKRDKVLMTKSYFTSEKLLILKQKMAVFLQRCWRGYVARCRAHRVRLRNLELQLKEEEDKKIAYEIEMEKREMDMQRRLNPKSNSDFASLFNEMDTWRRMEVAKVKASTAPGEERRKALAAVLDDETKALQSIQRLKSQAQKQMYEEKTQQMLEEMAKPQKWQLSSGDVALVQTPETVRAKELLDLFMALGAPSLSTDERLDVLLHVKWTVKEFDCQITRDIAELIDREADLLNRGRPARSMEKLRIRLSNMFLQFIEDPKFNKRAAQFVGITPQPLLTTNGGGPKK